MTTFRATQRERHVFWQRWEEPGLEHFCLREDDTGVEASGMLVGLVDGHTLRLRYDLRCERDYRFNALERPYFVGYPAREGRFTTPTTSPVSWLSWRCGSCLGYGTQNKAQEHDERILQHV